MCHLFYCTIFAYTGHRQNETEFFPLGFYVESSRPETLKMSCEEMEEVMKTEIIHGVEGEGVKCGIIGEIGCSWPLGS